MRILAIETSCDETAAAIVQLRDNQPVVLTNVVASQLKTHAKTGGVVPDIAARLHSEALPRVLDEATEQQKLDYDAVAVTVGPGLVGCLLLGLSAAKAISAAKGLPFFAINHLEGHVYSAWLSPAKTRSSSLQPPTPVLPALIVIVSGGHTELVLMQRHLRYEALGSTRDDAAGEAFDKVARLLDLPYPGGPAISELAAHGDRDRFHFPIALKERDSFEFSFSGLKASVYHLVKGLAEPLGQHTKADIAASFEHTVALTISRKVTLALETYPEIETVCLVGGVAANKHLRVYLEQEVKKARSRCRFVVAPFEYCTDNAAMIGAAACFHHLFGQPDRWQGAEADPNMTL